ncbi:MAG: ACT domain-containing protein [Ignavibacteria bacterium]
MKLSEEEIRKITLTAISELGKNASPSTVKKVVEDTVGEIEKQEFKIDKPENSSGGRVIITAFGLNQPGVVAAITNTLGDCNCDIQDLTQKLMSDFFTIIMVVDISECSLDFNGMQKKVQEVAEKMNFKIYIQHEDIFRYMHRI